MLIAGTIIFLPNLIRIILGFLLIFLIPGFLLSVLLLPELDKIERLSYSLCLSIIIIIIDGTILNFIWEISLIPIIITLTLFILITGFFVFRKNKELIIKKIKNLINKIKEL